MGNPAKGLTDFTKNTMGSINDAIPTLPGPIKDFNKNTFGGIPRPNTSIPKAITGTTRFLEDFKNDPIQMGRPDTPDTPAAAGAPGVPTPVMPTTDSEAVRMARRRLAAAFAKRGGRASTVLTGTSDKLGA